MASRKPTHCSCYVLLIYYILSNKVGLDCKLILILLSTENTMGMTQLKNDVTSDYSHYWMFYNTHRNDLDACKYTGCPRRNGQNFERAFLMLNYTDITQNTYIQSWTVKEIMATEVWNFDICYTLTDYQIHIETGRNMWFL